MPSAREKPASSHPRGLCDACVHVSFVTSGRGTTFLMCGRSKTDERFPKYPPLPVRACVGFEAGPAPDSTDCFKK